MYGAEEEGSRVGLPSFMNECGCLLRCELFLFELREAVGEELFEIFERLREAFDAFLQLVVRHAVGGVHLVEGGLVHGDLVDLHVLGLRRIELARQLRGVRFELGEQLGGDGQQIAAGEFLDLAECCGSWRP